MNLQEIIELKAGQSFVYRGEPTKVIWTTFSKELVGERSRSKEDKTKIQLYANHFGMAFVHKGFTTTIISMFPDPVKLILPEYEHSN